MATSGVGSAVSSRVDRVHIDGMVVLKIIKHAHASLPQFAAGSLLGLDEANTLDVTSTFPFPQSKDAADTEYQMEMLDVMRKVSHLTPCMRFGTDWLLKRPSSVFECGLWQTGRMNSARHFFIILSCTGQHRRESSWLVPVCFLGQLLHERLGHDAVRFPTAFGLRRSGAHL